MLLAALIRKEFAEIRRDPVTVALAVVLPLVMLFLFGYGLTMDTENVRTAILDEDRTQSSRELIERFVRTPNFRHTATLSRYSQIEPTLDRGRAVLVLYIPEGFERELNRNRTATVQALIDGSFSVNGLTVSNYVNAIVARHSRDLTEAALRGAGLATPATLNLDMRVWYNASLRTVNYLVPGLFAVLLLAFPPMLTALSIVREKERGTIEQIYVSPLSAPMYILGKAIPYALIAFAEMLLVLVTGTLWFEIPFRGSVLLLLAVSLIYVLVTVGIGILVSTVTRSQVAAVLLSLVATLMPSFLFSGFLFPISAMPYMLQFYTYLFPARYFTEISRDLFLKGVGFEFIWVNVVLLALYAAVLLGIASLRFRKKVAS